MGSQLVHYLKMTVAWDRHQYFSYGTQITTYKGNLIMKCNGFFTCLTYLYDYEYVMGIYMYNLEIT